MEVAERPERGRRVRLQVIRDDIIGVENDGALMSFNTWRAMQPDAERSGLVLTANDHATRTCSAWWAGPETDFLAGCAPRLGPAASH